MANIAKEYATKRYRSNLINWGMLPFTFEGDPQKLPFGTGDFIWIPGIAKAVKNGLQTVIAYVFRNGQLDEMKLSLPVLTEDEKTIILSGCLINYYKLSLR